MTRPATRHVILVTYGEPPTPEFAEQLIYSWRILVGLTRTVAPIPRVLLPMIALARARGRGRLWRSHDYSSPLEPITARQARLLEASLADAADGERFRVHVAYEFRAPLLDDVLARLPEGEPAIVVPMYAADSAFTHNLSRGIADAHARAAARPVRVMDAVEAEHLALISAQHVMALTADAPEWRGSEVAVLLSAHGTVLAPPRPIDTGLAATEALRRAITDRLSPHFGQVVNGWLNHTRGGPWTDPPVEKALHDLVAAGFTRVVYFPYGFLADNAESQLEGRVALAARPELRALHLPCLNESPLLAGVLARQILAAA